MRESKAMSSRTNRRITVALMLIGGVLLMTAGCGDTLRGSIKEGIFNWVSGSLNADLVSLWLVDLLTGT